MLSKVLLEMILATYDDGKMIAGRSRLEEGNNGPSANTDAVPRSHLHTQFNNVSEDRLRGVKGTNLLVLFVKRHCYLTCG